MPLLSRRPAYFRQVSLPTHATPTPTNNTITPGGWTMPLEQGVKDASLFEFDYEADVEDSWTVSTRTSRSKGARSQAYKNRHVQFAPTVLVKRVISPFQAPRISLNPILATDSSPFSYDISLPVPPLRSLKPSDLSQPALFPPSSLFRIACELIPWPIDISLSNQPHPPTHSPFITCLDVLDSLYYHLQHRIHPSEWDTRSSKQKDLITKAYLRRCRITDGDEKKEQLKGVRRVDWLMRNTIWMGLSPSYDKEETWVLTLGQHRVRDD